MPLMLVSVIFGERKRLHDCDCWAHGGRDAYGAAAQRVPLLWRLSFSIPQFVFLTGQSVYFPKAQQYQLQYVKQSNPWRSSCTDPEHRGFALALKPDEVLLLFDLCVISNKTKADLGDQEGTKHYFHSCILNCHFVRFRKFLFNCILIQVPDVCFNYVIRNGINSQLRSASAFIFTAEVVSLWKIAVFLLFSSFVFRITFLIRKAAILFQMNVTLYVCSDLYWCAFI